MKQNKALPDSPDRQAACQGRDHPAPTAADGEPPIVSARRALLQGLLVLPALARARDASAVDEKRIRVAALDQLAQPWSAVEFNLPIGGEPTPGIVIRLPGADWYACSRICPHAKCETIYFSDVQAASDTFDVKLSNPVLGCPCHFSVFDVANGGKVISGPAPQPLQRFEVSVEGADVYVVR
jgi:Rieske Fe-S protein